MFRRVALSALLDSAEKVTATKKPEDKEEGKHPGPKRYCPIGFIDLFIFKNKITRIETHELIKLYF